MIYLWMKCSTKISNIIHSVWFSPFQILFEFNWHYSNHEYANIFRNSNKGNSIPKNSNSNSMRKCIFMCFASIQSMIEYATRIGSKSIIKSDAFTVLWQKSFMELTFPYILANKTEHKRIHTKTYKIGNYFSILFRLWNDLTWSEKYWNREIAIFQFSSLFLSEKIVKGGNYHSIEAYNI